MAGRRRRDLGVALSDIIKAGILVPPVSLCRKYKGRMMEATLRGDGSVEFQGKRYSSCSAAGEAARAVVTGKRRNTNGWQFWQTRSENGTLHELIEARKRYLSLRGNRLSQKQ